MSSGDLTDLDGMTESEGFSALWALEHRFGWFGMVMCRGDVESLLEAEDIDLTDEMWDEVRDTYEWRKGLSEALVPHAFDILGQMLDDMPSVVEAREA